MRERNTFPIREVAAAALLMAGATAAQSATLGLYVSGPDEVESTIPDLNGTENFAASDTWILTDGATGNTAVGSYLVTGDEVESWNDTNYGVIGAGDRYLSIGGLGSKFTLTPPADTKYLGFWWSAGSGGNTVELFDENDNKIASLNTSILTSFLPNNGTIVTAINGSTTYATSEFYGKPVGPNQGATPGEAFAYVHLVLTDSEASIARVEFSTTSSGFELDNISTRTAEIPPSILPPTFVSVTNVTAEDKTVYAWSTDTNATATASGFGTPGTIAFSTPNATSSNNGAVSSSGPTLTLGLTDAAKAAGEDSFHYQATLSGNNFYATGTVTVLIATLENDSNSTAFETAVTGDVSTNDTFPPSSSYTITPQTNANSSANGEVTLDANGAYTYTPAAGFSGTDTFTYEVCAPDSTPAAPNCNDATVTILVGPNAVNDGPYLASATTGSVITNDDVPSDSTPTSYDVTANPTTGGALDIAANGDYTYTPPTNYAGVEEFSYTITVGDANSGPTPQTDTATITFIVPPQANGGTGTTTVGTPTTVALPNEVWPANPVLTSTPSVNGGTVSFDSNGIATYTPAPGFGGIDTVEYQVCLPDPNETVCDTSTITVTVAPTAADKSITGTPNTPIGGNLTPENPSAPTGSTYEVVTPPANGNVTLNPDGSFVYMPNTSWEGDDSFTYRICTGTVCSAPATVSIKVSSGQIANVPTMSVGGLLAMSGLLGGMAAFVRRRKKSN